MKYLKLVLTLVFIAAGVLLYLGNKEFMHGDLVINFDAFVYEATAVHTKNGIALASVFLLGMIFALIHSSLNWIELIRKNRKISSLESKISEDE